jgi:hypothetical protein
MIEVRYTENYDAIVSIDGIDTHDGHVIALKEDLYSFISDASKEANGCRRRLNIHEYTVAELEDLADYYAKAANDEAEREEARQEYAIEKFEAAIARIIECGAGDRETAVRWFRDAHFADDEMGRMYGDERICYDLGLPFSYDLDHADRKRYEREAAARAAA